MTRKLIPFLALVALLGAALAAAPAVALPCNPDTDPDCDPGGEPTVRVVQTDLDVGAPSSGTITTDDGTINCGASCHADYSFTRSCADFECEDTGYDFPLLNASGGPAGYSPRFSYCPANTAGTACTGAVTTCAIGACQLTIDGDYRATLEWLDTTPPGKASLSGPAKVGPGVRTFSASSSDNSPGGVAAMKFVLDGIAHPLDTAAPFQFSAPVETLVEGTHTLVAAARDGAGNEGEGSDTITFEVDRHTSASIASPPAGGHFSSPPLVSFTRDDTDDVDTTCQTLKGGTVLASTACSTSFTPDIGDNGDGDYVARVIVTDDVGNQATAERGFKIDTGDPNITINSPTTGQHVKSPFTPGITATDGVTPSGELVVECRVGAAGSFSTCGPQSAADGSHTLFVRAVDKAGNVRVESVDFVADSTGPQVNVTSGPPDNAIVNATSVTYAWTSADPSPPLATTCKLDTAAATACSSPRTLSGLSEGPHTLTLRVADALGNATTVTRDIFVNAVRPRVSITGGPSEGAVVKSRSVAFSFAASGGAVSCSLDSETAFGPCSSGGSHSLGGLADGAHTFRVRVADESDDVVVASRTFRVDTAVAPPPPPPILNPTLSTDYDAFKRYTRYTRLVVRGVPAGATVTVKCKGKKCPRKSFKTRKSGNVKLSKFVKKKLRAGTKLTIRVTKPGTVGKQFVIRIRAGKRPTLRISQIA